MLYQLCFTANHLTLPLNYQSTLQGMIYNLIAAAPNYSAFLHDSGYSTSVGTKFKLFCFGRLEGQHSIHNRMIVFPHAVSLALRTADPMLGGVLDEILGPGLHCELGRQQLVLEQVERETIHLTESVIHIRMNSPIDVHTSSLGKTRYYNPLEMEFGQLVNENYHHKWESACGAPPEDDVKLKALSVGMQDKCVTKIKGIWVTAWGGTYQLQGKPKALEFLYHSGLGGRNSMGFGLFHIKRQDGKAF